MEDKKIIVRREVLPGVDMSVSDFSYAFSTPVAWTEVVRPIFKQRGIWLIGLKENLNVRDVIQMVGYPTKYKIIKLVRVLDDCKLYRIKRVDDFPITNVDTSTITKGQRVRIKNRSGIKHGMFSTKK